MSEGASIETLYRVSEVLSRSLDYRQTLREVLDVLAEAGLGHGLISVIAGDGDELAITMLQGAPDATRFAPVRYQSGEGVLGSVFERGTTLAVPRLGHDPRFLNRLGIYDPERPLIATPITANGRTLGVLAVQPEAVSGLEAQTRFVEMIANLIGQNVRLALEVDQERQWIADERDALRRTLRSRYGFENIVGRSIGMRRVFEQVRLVAKWNTTVLIRGETGTGKELIASAIHYNSPRARGPYVRLNCAALPENLLESELFGHEKGAFTGAIGTRKGRFEAADSGTLFLDEIGEISPSFQVKLLRVLQEGEFERVGSTRTLKVDVRVIAATHRDLESAVASGQFREDLYYRLNVMPIVLPPLRERSEDIPDLARHLIEQIAKQQGRPLVLHEGAIRRLMQYSWPGNVRELENCLERAAVMSENGSIGAELIQLGRAPAAQPVRATPTNDLKTDSDVGEPSERERIIAALEKAGWVQAKAARLLGMTPRQIAYRIQTLGIEVKQF
ncbi:nif-specific transcriptional activator NifA [Thermochromatium tepidum]|uniref:Nif-specific regulatory protein n=1 Tax=Thermochromatium tepidum ATCC 43061 TaxID=316276 RepID=A0A6I6E013_THETI|nr:nif-specific transcriptional activator NifA [Thermochromatium tepidum]QGU33194.1 nif-specific transcriptional activator NifA [Thermochromatium tepidum ATCC 43061]